jgi:hypothetical protein
MVIGVAEEEFALFWAPLTPKEMTVPIRIPNAKVTKISTADPKRRSLNFDKKALTRAFILSLPPAVQPHLKK